jgi:nucleotide-binding universal stress UspA family protein
MNTPTGRRIVCGIDYSAESRTALRYAIAAAHQLEARLTAISVADVLLVEAMQAAGRGNWRELEQTDLHTFCTETMGRTLDIDVDVRLGAAATEILAAADQLDALLIVLGCHGLTGIRKLFLGSTTERVLRDTTRPVLVTPADVHAPAVGADARSLLRHIVVPVDLTDASESIAVVGARLGALLSVPVMLVHVVEPVVVPARWRGRLPSVQAEARARADAIMKRLAAEAGGNVEPIVVVGEPATQIATVAEVRGAGLIVMGLQERGTGRVGVIAYRILSQAHVPVLAIPVAAAQRMASSSMLRAEC